MAEGQNVATPESEDVKQAAEAERPDDDSSVSAIPVDVGEVEHAEAPIIDGRYEVLSVLGEGGFGVVYKGRQISTGQVVAIKLLHADLMEDENHRREYVARFEREMQVIGSMKHTNIVRLIDKGVVENGELFMVLEFVDGKSLWDVIEDEGPLSLSETMHLMLQVLDALHAAHCLGIVHRDLKPHNIMLTSTGYRRNAIVLDFGIAGVVEGARGTDYRTLTKASEIRGTPAYMAPEQLRSKKLAPQIDLYAWGLVFLECLTGEPAVDGESPFDVALWQVGDDKVKIPDGLVGDGMREILSRVTDKNIKVRYRSAAEVFEAFEELDLSGVAGANATAISVAASNPRRPRNLQDAHTAALDGGDLERDTNPGQKAAGGRDPEAAVATTMLDTEAIERHQSTLTGRDAVSASGLQHDPPPPQARGSAARVAVLAVLITALVGVGVAWVLWPESAVQSEAEATPAEDGQEQARTVIDRAAEDISLHSLREGIARLELLQADSPDDPVVLGGLARLHATLGAYGLDTPTESFTHARDLGRKALAANPDQGDAHLAVALASLFLERDPTAAEGSFKAAIAQDPALGAEYARFMLAPQGRFDDARQKLDAARVARDAPSSRIALAAAHVEYLAGATDDALAQADAALTAQRTAFLAHYERGLAHTTAGRFTDAQAAFDTARSLQDEAVVLGALGYTLARAGNGVRARELLDLLEAKIAVDGRVLPEHIAWIYIGLGEVDEAFTWLDKALEAHSSGLIELGSNPIYQSITGDPRFQPLAVRAGVKAP